MSVENIATRYRFQPGELKSRLPASFLSRPRLLHRRPRIVAAQSYSPTIDQSFSGSTYYFTAAGIDAGLFEGAMGFVSPSHWQNAWTNAQGCIWKTGRWLQGRPTSGFKFSRRYLDLAWRRVLPALRGVDIVSNFQMVSPLFCEQRRKLDTGLHFFIDGTLSEYFGTYSAFEAGNVDPQVVVEALEIERLGYHDADTIMAMSKGTAEVLAGDYGVDPGKISVVLPGANLLDCDIPIEPAAPDPDNFVLSFVGIYPMRKGLARLLRAVTLLRAQGRNIKIRIIGSAPDEVIANDAVEFLGRIDKRTDAKRFINATSSAHFGCLLSEAELGGIGLVESVRVGVPAIGTGVGGMKDLLAAFGGVTAPVDLSDAELATLIARFMDEPGRYSVLRANAVANRAKASWTRAAQEIDAVLTGWSRP